MQSARGEPYWLSDQAIQLTLAINHYNEEYVVGKETHGLWDQAHQAHFSRRSS